MRSTLATLASLLLAAPAFAGSGAPLGHGGPGRHRPDGPAGFFDPERFEERLDEHADRLAELLDLSAEQKSAFETLRQDRFDDARTTFRDMRTQGEALRALLDAGSTDAAAIGAKVIVLHQLHRELEASRESFEADLSKILTEEQRFAFEALREARDDLRERRPLDRFRGPRRGGPDRDDG